VRLPELALLALAGCGGSVCGNGQIESGEQCDDGNTADGDGCSATCRAEATIDTFLHWEFVTDEYPGFTGETCQGVNVSTVQLTLTGPKPMTKSGACSDGQVKLSSLPAGTYRVDGAAFDPAGTTVTRGLSSKSFTVAGASQDVYLDFSYADLVRPYTGTYYFKTRWGGAASCATASPPVVKERVRLERGGAPLGGMTGDGVPLDGSSTGPCRDFNDTSQFANGLAWGPASITITGEDGAGTVLYHQTLDTFVGAGIANPTAEIDVASIAPDAGVADAPIPFPDAGGSD